MAASNSDDTLIFLKVYPQLASKHLKLLLDALTDMKHLSTNSAKQSFMLCFFLNSGHLLCHNY